MKVLTIGLDKNALNFDSPTGKRLFEYAGLVEKLDIIVLGSAGENKHDKNLSVFTTSKNKIKSLLRAYKLGKDILGSGSGEYLISTQDPFFTGLIGYLLKIKLKKPIQMQIHIDLFGPYFKNESLLNWISVFIAKKILPKADGIRVVSEKIKDDLVSFGISENKIFVLPVFTDVEKIINYPVKTNLHQKYPQFNFLMLIASRLVKQKNIDLAILSTKEIVSRYPKTGLLIVGSGPEEKKFKKMSQNNPSIIFESWSDDLVSYFKTSDILLLPSFYEGFVRTAVEAMAAGCPVLMSNMILSGDIFSAGYTCLSFNTNSQIEFIEKIIYAIENKESMEEIKKHALDSVKALPTKEEYLSNYLKSWQNCFS